MSRMVQTHSFANFTKKCQKTKYNLIKNAKVLFLHDMCLFQAKKDDFAERTGILKSFNVNAGRGSLK